VGPAAITGRLRRPQPGTFLRAHGALVGVLAALALIVAVAELDHAHKRAAGNAAQLAEWYCAHRGERCGGADSERIQRRWEERELGYRTAFALTAVAGVALLVRTRRRRP
jgi:hypothetical protein